MLLVKILIMFNGAKTPRALINSRWIAGKYCAIVRNSGLSPKNFKVEKAEKSCASFSKRDWFTTQRDVVWLSWSTLILLKLSPSINNMESVISRAIISTQHQHVNDQHALLVRQSVDLRRQKLVFEIFFCVLLPPSRVLLSSQNKFVNSYTAATIEPNQHRRKWL